MKTRGGGGIFFIKNGILSVGLLIYILMHVVCVCMYHYIRYVLMLSGLNLGSSWCDQLSIEMMVDYITGQLGGAKAS